MPVRLVSTFTLPAPLVQRMADILGRLPHNQVHVVLSELQKYRPNPPPASPHVVDDPPPGGDDGSQQAEGKNSTPH